MYFKPRIFISSSLDIDIVRNISKTILEESGAEVILYEYDLTPSIKKYTYRFDIKEVDFIIFIFDNRYGSITNSGKSGTHEEWDIARNSSIPSHVYINENISDERLSEFVHNEINSKGISYYLYNDTDDLLAKIKKTIFTISRDAFVYRLSYKSIPETTLKNMSFTFDCDFAFQVIEDIDDIIKFHTEDGLDLLMTNILNQYFEELILKEGASEIIFNDSRFEEKFRKIIKNINNFIDYQNENLSPKNSSFQFKFKSKDEVIYCDRMSKDPSFSYKELKSIFEIFKESYSDFKEYASSKKLLINLCFR